MRFLTTLAFCLFLTSTGWSQTPFFPFEDTFDGSNMDDPVTWTGVPLFEGAVPAPAIEMTGGQLKLSGAPSLVPFGLDFSVGVVEVQNGGQAVFAGDGTTAQTVFNPPENAYGSIYTKGGEDGDSYFANITSEGFVNMGNFADVVNQSTFPTNIDPVGKDIVLQMTTLSDRIQASVWVDGDLSTKESFEIAVGARDPGFFGLAFGAGVDEATGMIPDVTVPFNEFSIVPEPSSVSLVAFGVLGVLGFRRRADRSANRLPTRDES